MKRHHLISVIAKKKSFNLTSSPNFAAQELFYVICRKYTRLTIVVASVVAMFQAFDGP